jgi:beta-galactosidase
VHIFPHWNWAGKEGQPISVWCFSNCDEVELFLNGQSQGRQTMPPYGHLQWDHVLYTPGTLQARGYRKGQSVAEDLVVTTGSPAALHLVADRMHLVADSEDTVPVAVAVVDSLGRVVPTANNLIEFSVKGRGRNAGVGNGDPSSHEPNQADSRSAFNGLCMVLVQATDKAGDFTLEATGDGLAPAALVFHTVKGTI